jgi:hypothetical protein
LQIEKATSSRPFHPLRNSASLIRPLGHDIFANFVLWFQNPPLKAYRAANAHHRMITPSCTAKTTEKVKKKTRVSLSTGQFVKYRWSKLWEKRAPQAKFFLSPRCLVKYGSRRSFPLFSLPRMRISFRVSYLPLFPRIERVCASVVFMLPALFSSEPLHAASLVCIADSLPRASGSVDAHFRANSFACICVAAFSFPPCDLLHAK